MATIITHDGRVLHITIEKGNKAVTYYINKQQIRLIDYRDEETVRINFGEGVLKPIYIEAGDVTNPSGLNSAKLVRAYLTELWSTDANDEATQTQQLAQSEKLEEMRELLDGIKTVLTVYNPANIFNQPLIMDNATAGTTYYGYAVAGTAVNAGGWAIKKVIVSGGNTNILWANGNLNLVNVWNNRATFTYANATLP